MKGRDQLFQVEEILKTNKLRWTEKLFLRLYIEGTGRKRFTLRETAYLIGRSRRETDRIRARVMRKLAKFGHAPVLAK